MRTFSREDWTRAQAEWLDFSPEWRGTRHRAAMRGILFPPEGTALDSWDDDSPSQRAMLVRAIRETPKLLEVAIERSRSWGQVIAVLVGSRDEMRAEVDREDRDVARRRSDEPSGREATFALKRILDRIGDS